MGKPTGFLEYKRETAKVLPPKVRIANFNEFRTFGGSTLAVSLLYSKNPVGFPMFPHPP